MPEKFDQPKYALAFSIGAVITGNIVGGIALGYFLDRWLQSSPWLSVAGLVLGTVGAFTGVFRIMSRLNRSD
jgi:ATP synthase protein I